MYTKVVFMYLEFSVIYSVPEILEIREHEVNYEKSKLNKSIIEFKFNRLVRNIYILYMHLNYPVFHD